MSEPLAVPVALQRGRPLGWWGMLVALATEGALFGTMIASYFYLRFRTPEWPPRGTPEPRVLEPSLLTLLLVLTSVPTALAVWSARRQLAARARTGLLATTVLASVYLAGVAWLLLDEWDKSPATKEAYDSLFFTLQGAHAAHVLLGVLVNLYLLVKIARRPLTQYRVNGVWAIGLYWHFVNALAVLVLLTTISPAL
jgi:heme/copper-type cytochrome/quinol oxidase subunit 3